MKKRKLSVLPIFPLHIFKTKINRTKKQKEELIKLIKEIEKKYTSRGVSNCGGYHSPFFDYDSLKGTSFEFLYQEILTIFNKALITGGIFKEKLGQFLLTERDIYTMWFIINKKNDFNQKHIHVPSWYSAVYYVKVPKNSGNLIFHDCVFARVLEALQPNITPIKPKEGELYIFPSYLEHSVDKNQTNKERICISFNIGRPDYILKTSREEYFNG